MPIAPLQPIVVTAPAATAVAVPVLVPPHQLLGVDLVGVVSGKVSPWAMVPHVTMWLFDTGLVVILVAVLTLLSLKFYQILLSRLFLIINHNLKPDAVARVSQRSNTLSGMLGSAGKVLIIFLGLTIILAAIGVNVAPLLASAGIAGLAVGFGAQSLVKDVINGFFILTEDQYGVGDVIEIEGKTGLVEKMNLRITQLRNQHGQLITIPNGHIVAVINHSKEWARAVLEIGVPFEEDPDRVITVLEAIGAEILAEMPDKVLEAVEVLGVEAFKETEVVIKLQIKTLPLEQWIVARAFRRKVILRFKEHGIRFPNGKTMMWLASAGENPDDDISRFPSKTLETPRSQAKSVQTSAVSHEIPREAAMPEIPAPQSSVHGE
jgi:small-conductance mechanosensitive channel